MRERAAKFNVEKIKPQDLTGAGGSPSDKPFILLASLSTGFLNTWTPQ
jgi:hypothetical protein